MSNYCLSCYCKILEINQIYQENKNYLAYKESVKYLLNLHNFDQKLFKNGHSETGIIESICHVPYCNDICHKFSSNCNSHINKEHVKDGKIRLYKETFRKKYIPHKQIFDNSISPIKTFSNTERVNRIKKQKYKSNKKKQLLLKKLRKRFNSKINKEGKRRSQEIKSKQLILKMGSISGAVKLEKNLSAYESNAQMIERNKQYFPALLVCNIYKEIISSNKFILGKQFSIWREIAIKLVKNFSQLLTEGQLIEFNDKFGENGRLSDFRERYFKKILFSIDPLSCHWYEKKSLEEITGLTDLKAFEKYLQSVGIQLRMKKTILNLDDKIQLIKIENYLKEHLKEPEKVFYDPNKEEIEPSLYSQIEAESYYSYCYKIITMSYNDISYTENFISYLNEIGISNLVGISGSVYSVLKNLLQFEHPQKKKFSRTRSLIFRISFQTQFTFFEFDSKDGINGKYAGNKTGNNTSAPKGENRVAFTQKKMKKLSDQYTNANSEFYNDIRTVTIIEKDKNKTKETKVAVDVAKIQLFLKDIIVKCYESKTIEFNKILHSNNIETVEIPISIWNDQTRIKFRDEMIKFLVRICPKNNKSVTFNLDNENNRKMLLELQRFITCFTKESVTTFNSLKPIIIEAMDDCEKPILVEFSDKKKIYVIFKFKIALFDFKTGAIDLGASDQKSNFPCFTCFSSFGEFFFIL